MTCQFEHTFNQKLVALWEGGYYDCKTCGEVHDSEYLSRDHKALLNPDQWADDERGYPHRLVSAPEGLETIKPTCCEGD